MGRILTLVLLCCSVSAGPALAAAVRHVGSTWVMENAALRVTVDEDTARMSVLPKATGLLWEQEGAPLRSEAAPQVQVRRAAAAPTIDGDNADWSWEGVIWLPWVGEDGERNLSGGALVRWDEQNLYLYVRVRDQTVAFGRREPQQWWEADSVEFWVDSVQVGLHLHPDNLMAANAQGEPYAGSRLAVRLIENDPLPGYGVELAMPLEHFPILKDPEAGVRFYFAVGLNDADPEAGQPVQRVAQGYYPRTWVHSEPRTFAVAVLTDAEGEAPPLTKENDRTGVLFTSGVADMRGTPDAITYSMTLVRGQPEPLRLAVELALVGDEPVLDMTLSSRGGDGARMGRLSYPRPLFPPDPERYFMTFADYCDGRYVWVGDEVYRHRWLQVGGQLDMPWVAVTDGTQGMMAISLTPEDTVFLMQSRRGDGQQFGFPGLMWEPSKGEWGHDRRVRYAFFEKGGHVAACKLWRKIAQDWAMFRTLADKTKTNPDVAKLMGSVDWWGAPGLHFVKEAMAEGITRGLVNGRWAPEDMAEMVRLGWLVGEYDNYVDIDDAPEISPHKAPVDQHAVVKADGELMTAWVVRGADMKPVRHFMKHCTAKQLECARAIIPDILKTYPYNTRFLDVTSAESLLECYSPDHPTTRASDRANRQALQRYVSDELGLVAGGEHGRWWSVPYLDYHEGMMGGGHYSWPAGYLRDVKDRNELGERYLNYGINPANRAPLFELAYHDCVVNYWYWGATNDYLHQVAPEITERKTAMNVLYGTPPMMWVNSHGLRWSVPEQREQMLTIYRNTCKLHEVIGMQEMVSHEFLTEDRMVQRTVWEDGTTCTVNFGKTPYRVAAGDVTLELGESDFYVNGPEIEQWRVSVKGAGQGDDRTRQTVIRTDDYLFVESGAARFENVLLSCVGQAALQTAGPHRAHITLSSGTDLELHVSAWRPDWRAVPRVLIALDEGGRPVRRVEGGHAPTLKLRAPAEQKARYLLLAGDEALVPDLTIERLALSVDGRAVEATTALGAGDTIDITVRLRNLGLSAAEQVALWLRLGGPRGPVLASFDGLTLAPGAERTLRAQLPAAKADGPRQITAQLDAAGPVSLTGRTQADAALYGPVVLRRFPFRRSYILRLPPGDSAGMAVEMPFDLNGMEKVGGEGATTDKEGKGLVEGMRLDRGYLSAEFITDPEKKECVLEDCYVLVHQEKISSVQDFVPLLEKIHFARKPLLVIAQDFDSEVLAVLLINNRRGLLTCCAVKAPGLGDRCKAIMQDVAVLVGGRVISEDLGLELKSVGLSDLGRANKVVITADDTTIMPEAVEGEDTQGRLSEGRTADPANLRLLFDGGLVAPAQFEATQPGGTEGTLVFCVPPGLRAGEEASARVMGVPVGSDLVFSHASKFDVAADGSRIRMGNYVAKISRGVLNSISLLTPAGDEQPVMENIIVSSAETGWSSEDGEVEQFKLLASGPVRAVFACTKVLRNGTGLTRRWSFYADRFEIHSQTTPHIGTLTRARYVAEGTATNETGRTASMDGVGDAEDFGFQGRPTWYAVFSDRYRNACIALTEPSGFTWWDAGVMGQVSLNHGGDGPEKRVYIWGAGAKDDGFARAAAEAYGQGVGIRQIEK